MKNLEYSSAFFPLTVVIPTLGGDALFKTIDFLNRGTIVPEEILVCIPKEEASQISGQSFENVKIVTTESRGQVKQRSEGFKVAEHNYVMQLDDDIKLNADSISVMIGKLEQIGCGNVIGPSFYNQGTTVSLHKYDLGVVGFLKSINASFFCAAAWGVKRMGKVTSMGVAYGVDPAFAEKDTCRVDWLPGGCVLAYKKDLIRQDFFPLPGKAFSEDIIHSLLRTGEGIKHYVAIKARAETTVGDELFSRDSFKAELKARSYVLNLLQGSKFRFRIWCFVQLLARQFKNI